MERLISELVDDANELVWAAEDLDLNDTQAAAVALLALVAGQDVEPGDNPGTWRIAQRTAPDRVISTVDPESRHAHKTAHSYRDGFKAHVAIEPETGLVTDCDLTAGTTSDAAAAPDLIDHEPEGTEVLGDSAYGSGELRDHLEKEAKTAVIKPPPLRPAVPGGFDLDDFDIDEEAGTVTCPTGVVVTLSAKRRASFGANCRACPLRRQCNHGQGRAGHRPAPPSPSSRRRPGLGEDRGLRRRLPALATDGGTQLGLAHPGHEPQAPLPGRGAEPALVVPPLCGRQPAAPDHPRPHRRRRRDLGDRLRGGSGRRARTH